MIMWSCAADPRLDDDEDVRERVRAEPRAPADRRTTRSTRGDEGGRPGRMERAAEQDQPTWRRPRCDVGRKALTGARQAPSPTRSGARDRLGRLGQEVQAALVSRRRSRSGGPLLPCSDHGRSRGELFHRSATEFLHEWRRVALRAGAGAVCRRRSRFAARARDSGAAGAQRRPYAFPRTTRKPGRSLLERFELAGVRHPVVILHDERVLENRTTSSLRGWGFRTTSSLAAASTWSSSAPARPGSLVPSAPQVRRSLLPSSSIKRRSAARAGSSSRIRNYLGFALWHRGAEPRSALVPEVWIFGTTFLLAREVEGLRPGRRRRAAHLRDQPRITARTNRGRHEVSRTTRLGVPALDELVGRGVFYGASPSIARQYAVGARVRGRRRQLGRPGRRAPEPLRGTWPCWCAASRSRRRCPAT